MVWLDGESLVSHRLEVLIEVWWWWKSWGGKWQRNPELIRAARAGGWPLELEQTLRSARACS